MASKYKSRTVLLLILGLILTSTIYLGISSLKSNFPMFNLTHATDITEDFIIDINSADDFEHFKQFTVTENTGSNQTNVIIDPISFTEVNKYCFKDSIRIFKDPYNSSDELISQIYNLKPQASETFSSTADWEDPNGWTSTERPNTNIRVLPRFGGYKKIVEMYDNSTTGDYCDISSTYSSKTSGTFYITVMTTTKNTTLAIALTGFGGYATSIGFFKNGSIYYHDSPTGDPHDSGIQYEINKWYTFKVTFNCTSDKYSAWVWDENPQDWAVVGLDIDFVVAQGYVDKTWIHTSGTDKGAFYIAAMDYSWEIGYEEDRILYVDSANIAFIDNLTASETRTYRVYYNSTPTAPAGYTNISRSGYTVNFTDGGSAIMNIDNIAVLRQFDTNGNEHLGGGNRYQMAHVASDLFGNLNATPIISDGPIFIEAWQIEDDNYWTYFRFYENSYIYRYQNYPGSGTCWFRGGLQADDKIIDFNEQYFHTGGAWENETFDYTGISWQDHYFVLDEGKMFTEDTGDSNILISLWDITPDPYL
ncbi:MAG: hypothetical protein HWN67_17680, partial [Candidatus Helarchaeota archaeon]|nr:hypothetical protein [Candidatus Helarchaeota archaeon]